MLCFQPGVSHLDPHFIAYDKTAHAQYIRIIHRFGPPGLIQAFTQGCIDASVLVAYNADTHARTAYRNAPVVFPALNALCHRDCRFLEQHGSLRIYICNIVAFL